MNPAQWKEAIIFSVQMCYIIYWSSPDTAMAYSSFAICREPPKESFWVGDAARAEPASIHGGETEVPGHWWFGRDELTRCMSVPLFLQTAQETGSGMCSLWKENFELLRVNWSSQRETISWIWERTEDQRESPHSSRSAALYIILKDPYARIMLHSERGDCFTYLMWEGPQITALPAYIITF